MTLDSQTLDEWDSETHIQRCDIDKYAARNSILIDEIRKLQEREAAFRDSLNSIKRAASEEQPTLRDKFYFDLADEVLARYPDESAGQSVCAHGDPNPLECKMCPETKEEK